MTFRKTLHISCRVAAMALLVIMTRHVLADCQSDSANGWSLDNKCTTHFDDDGNYVDSYCQFVPNTNSGPYRMTCKPGDVEGTCTGSTCEGAVGFCVRNNGFCLTDLDCCDSNVCDPSSHRCGEPEGGLGWGFFQ